MPRLFCYNAKVSRVVDGDTVDADLDLGFKVFTKQRIRLYGINAPESRTRDLDEKKRGKAATARAKELLQYSDSACVIESHEFGKYGRALGTIWLPDENMVDALSNEVRLGLDELRRFSDGEYTSLNEVLVKEGHAVEYYGGKR